MNGAFQNINASKEDGDSFGLNPRECSFKPENYAITITDEEGNKALYLEVKYRILWFQIYCREQHINSYAIETDKAETVGNKYLQVAARVRINGEVVGSDIGGVYVSNNDNWYAVQRAATMAKGRALANAGFGAAFADDNSEDEKKEPCDSAYPIKEQAKTMPAPEIEPMQNLSPMEAVRYQSRTTELPASPPIPETGNPASEPAMTLEEARRFIIPSGSQRGRTLEQAGMQAVEYYSSERFRGRDIWIAANLILESKKAGQ